MKKLLAILLAVVLTASITAVASADISGYTSGGELGKTLIRCTLRIQNGSGAGQDSATATTKALIAGNISVKVTIFCTDENGKVVEGRGEGGTISSTLATGKAGAPTGSHAFRATSSHIYLSIGYGNFAKSDGISF